MACLSWQYLSIGLLLILNYEIEAVEFILYPTDVSEVQGTTITLQCGVNTEFRSGVHRIYWAFSGNHGQHTFLSVDRNIYSSLAASKRNRYAIVDATVLGKTEFNLQISNAQLEDIGMYECVLYDPFTGQRVTTPDPAKVVVLPLTPPDHGYPKCRVEPSNARPGTLATFTCISKGGLPRPTLTWRKHNSILPSTLNSTEDTVLDILEFKRYITQWDNNATFTCSVESPALAQVKNCSITPFEVPVAVKITLLQNVKIGQSAEFFCTASGVPEVNRYRWFVGRGDGADKITKSFGRYTLSSQGSYLRIRDVTERDNGVPVRCVARNQLDIKGVDENILRVISSRPTSNGAYNPTARHFLTTVPPKPVTPNRDSYDYGLIPTKQVHDKGVDTEGRFGPIRPKSTGSSGLFTVKTYPTMKQRSFNGPMVTHQIRNDLEHAPRSSGPNMSQLVSGATGLFLIVLIVFIILIVIVRRSHSSTSKKTHVQSVRRKTLRPGSTGTLQKSDIVVLPVPCLEDDEKYTSKPIAADGITTVKLISLEKAATLDKSKTNIPQQDFMSQLKGTLRSRNTYINFFDNEPATRKLADDTISNLSDGEIVRCDSAFCDDYRPGLSGSETALNDYSYSAHSHVSKNKSTDLSNSTGNLVYAELDFSQSRQTGTVKGGDDKTHYAEIRMSRDIDL